MLPAPYVEMMSSETLLYFESFILMFYPCYHHNRRLQLVLAIKLTNISLLFLCFRLSLTWVLRKGATSNIKKL